MRKDWHLIKIIHAQHLSKQGNVLWEAKNLYNTVHTEGEGYILTALFSDPSSIPTNYYFGLDARATIAVSYGIADLSGEPSGNNYARQLASSTGFTISVQGAHYRADSPLVIFDAIGGAWTSVKNLFLTDKVDGTGSLIASVSLSSTLTLSAGERITLQMGLSLTDALL